MVVVEKSFAVSNRGNVVLYIRLFYDTHRER